MKYLIFLKSGNYIGVSHYCVLEDKLWIEKKDFVVGSYETEKSVEHAEKIYIKKEDIQQIVKFLKVREK